MSTLHTSIGTLHYSVGHSHSLRVNIDQGIMLYYRALIPKSISTNKPMYEAHISVVRKETPVHLDHWEKYEGHEVEFQYEPIVRFGEVYCWLNCFSVRLEEIRVELGLAVHSLYTLPPEGFKKCFHSTIGNFKELG